MAKFYRSEDRTVLFELFGAGTSVENLKNLKANKQMPLLKSMYL